MDRVPLWPDTHSNNTHTLLLTFASFSISHFLCLSQDYFITLFQLHDCVCEEDASALYSYNALHLHVPIIVHDSVLLSQHHKKVNTEINFKFELQCWLLSSDFYHEKLYCKTICTVKLKILCWLSELKKSSWLSKII